MNLTNRIFPRDTIVLYIFKKVVPPSRALNESNTTPGFNSPAEAVIAKVMNKK